MTCTAANSLLNRKRNTVDIHTSLASKWEFMNLANISRLICNRHIFTGVLATYNVINQYHQYHNNHNNKRRNHMNHKYSYLSKISERNLFLAVARGKVVR